MDPKQQGSSGGDGQPSSPQKSAGGMHALENLAEELLVHITTFASAEDLIALGQVSRAWRARLRTNDALLWRKLAVDLWSSASSSWTLPASITHLPQISEDVRRSAQVREMEAMKRDLDRECGPTECPWRRFYSAVEQLERNWSAMRFARRLWYHNKAEALTVRYTEEELVGWEDTEDSEDPEGWDKSCIGALDVSVGGGRLVTGADDGSVRAWDPQGRLHGSYADEWNWNCISCVCHDDQVVVGAYTDRPVPTKTAVMVWDLNTGEQKHKFETAEQITDMALRSPILATCCGSNVDVWDLNTGSLVQQLDVVYPASQVEFHPVDPNVVVTGSIFSTKIKLWDLRSPEHCVAKARLQENLSRRFAYDGSVLVAGEVVELGVGGSVTEWDMRNLDKPRIRVRPRPELSVGDVVGVDFDHKTIVSLHEDSLLYLWSRIDGSIVDRVKLPINTEFLALNKDQGFCFVGGENRGIYRVDLNSKHSRVLEIEKPIENDGPLEFCDVTGLKVSRRGLFAAFRDGLICHYDFLTRSGPAPLHQGDAFHHEHAP